MCVASLFRAFIRKCVSTCICTCTHDYMLQGKHTTTLYMLQGKHTTTLSSFVGAKEREREANAGGKYYLSEVRQT